MSKGIQYLHSHSAIERDSKLPKQFVLIDVDFKNLFADGVLEPFFYGRKKYYKVSTLSFVRKGGVFKNLSE